MLRLVSAAILLVLMSAAVEAASFDCAKAGSPFEHAICDHADLSIQDDILARAYATALGGLSDEAAATIKTSQRDWLRYAQRVCSDDAEPITTTYTDEQAQCLAAVFRGRISDLEESRMRSGRRFYDINHYVVLPDPDAMPDSFQKVATKEFSSPRIDGDDEEAQGFNALLESFATGPDGGSTDGSTDESVAIVVEGITLSRIGLRVDSYWYGHGAAHGNYTITYLHYLIAEQRALEASDIFAGDGWGETLAELAYAELQKLFGEDAGALFISSSADIVDAVSDPSRWSFSDMGIILQFQPYEVTAYAAGAPTVTVSWDEIRGLLADGAENRAYY